MNSQPIHRGRARARSWRLAVFALATTGVALDAAGCSDGTHAPTSFTGPPILEAVKSGVTLRPGLTDHVDFRLRTEAGQPIANQPVQFAIVDDSTPQGDAAGATLATDSVLSDGNGNVLAWVTAGRPAMFHLRATAGTSVADTCQRCEATVGSCSCVLIQVSETDGSPVVVAPFFPSGSRAAGVVTRIQVYFYDDSSCSQISLVKPPVPGRAIVTLQVQGGVATGSATFNPVGSDRSNAIVARGHDGTGAVRAAGCVDQTGPVLVPGVTAQVALPLLDTNPSPVGAFDVTSDFTFAPALRGAAAVAAPWIDLQDCPLDPAQLWIDCTIDAIDGAPDGDPSDCRPGGGEGPLGDALAARRGKPILGVPVMGAQVCRSAYDASNAPSIDAKVMGVLTGASPPDLLLSLGGIAADAEQILAGLRLRSLLTIATTAAPDMYQATHRFDAVEMALGGVPHSVSLSSLGAPVLEARFVSAVADDDGNLLLGPHGITLRLGTVAREAFGQLALVGRGLPASSSALVGALAATADSVPNAGADGGCLAMDTLMCREAGQRAGCLGTACRDGLAALAAFLDGGFAALDGTGIDFVFDHGSAPLLDRHGSGVADRLGDRGAMPPRPGLWQAELHTATGLQTFAGSWDAEPAVR